MYLPCIIAPFIFIGKLGKMSDSSDAFAVGGAFSDAAGTRLGKIEAMIAATKALKPGSDSAVLLGPLVPPRKRRLVDNKVLTKMKTALKDGFNARNAKKRDSMLNDKLLDASLNEVQDFEEELSMSAEALTTMELRINEGMHVRLFVYLE